MDPQLKKHLQSKEGKGDDDVKEEEKKKETPKCPAIVSALNKTMQLSYGNLQPTGKRIMIAIELSDKMNGPCLKTKTISCLEAALITTLSILKTEREVYISVFNENQITPIILEKSKLLQKHSVNIIEYSSRFNNESGTSKNSPR